MKHTHLFAVTDHFVILPLKVISEKELRHSFAIETEVDSGILTTYEDIQHETYFKKMFVGLNGEMPKVNVFPTKETATVFQQKNLVDEIEIQERKLKALKAKLK